VFITSRALYILAFDVSKYAKSTFDRQIFFWYQAIQDRVPGAKIIVVGTHADVLTQGEAERRCQHVRMQLINRQHRVDAYLAKKAGRCRRALANFDTKTKAAAVAYMGLGLGISTTVEAVIRLQKRKADGDDLTPAEATLLEQ